MKVFYRKSYATFVCTDRYVRPWWWGFRHYLPTRPNSGAFYLSFLLSLAAAIIIPAFL